MSNGRDGTELTSVKCGIERRIFFLGQRLSSLKESKYFRGVTMVVGFGIFQSELNF